MKSSIILKDRDMHDLRLARKVYREFTAYKKNGIDPNVARQCICILHRLDSFEVTDYIMLGKYLKESTEKTEKVEKKKIRKQKKAEEWPDRMHDSVAERYTGINRSILRFYAERGIIRRDRDYEAQPFSYYRHELDRLIDMVKNNEI